MKSTIRLFKAVPVDSKKKKADKKLVERTIKLGFVFAPEVVASYPNYDYLINLVEEAFGMSPEHLNSSFHKSWKKIAEADIEQLMIEQILHYLTTYGFERFGIYNEDSIYIPREELDIPELEEENLRLIIIKGYTKNELKEKLMSLLQSGVALAEETKKDVLDVATFVGLDEKDVESVRNKEVRVALYEYLNLVPSNPTEFLRFVIYKSTNETLLIKNSELIEKIKEKDNLSVVKAFADYEAEYGLNGLAGIFYRFKPLFIAFRGNKRLRISVNRIRRLARKHHKPMPEDYLNNITAKLKEGELVERKTLTDELSKVNTFRKIRLAYALKYRTKDVDSILYRIRNGKGYATDFEFEDRKGAEETLAVVMESIVDDVKKTVGKKKVFIPDYINYALPATEKQYTGYFPSGTYVSVPRDMIFGINWKNVKRRIDLDLSLISPETGKMGWDANYRTEGRDILFSGDMTDASGKNGATELFYLKRQEKKSLILFLNYFNFDKDVEVPFKIVVASEKAENFNSNYTVNPNNLIAVAESKIDKKQKMLGLLVVTPEESRFYFTETNIGASITSSNSAFAENSRKYLFNFYEDSIYLKNVLKLAGVKFVGDSKKADIDLSPDSLEKDTILDLLK